MHTATLQLSPPAYLTLQPADGSPPAQIDVYEARRMLEDAGRKPSDAQKWNAVLDYLAGKLSVDASTLAENMALEFNDCIVSLVEALNEERKKKRESMRSSLTFIPESPATSAPGP